MSEKEALEFMAKVRRFATRTVHGFELISEDEQGQRVLEKVSVVYRSYSQSLLQEIEAAETTEGNKTVPYSAYLAHQVAAIADADGRPLTGDDGAEVVFYDGSSEEKLKKARAFFDGLSIGDVTRPMQEAIEADINPQKASLESGPSGSPAAASEA